MATSGSTNFTQARQGLVLDALQILGVYGIGRTVSAEDMSFSVSLLNKMIKAWQTKGLHLFTKTEGVLYITPNTPAYQLGNTAKATNASDEIISTLTNNQNISDTLLTIGSTSGMIIGDVIGIVLSDKSIFWSTIATIPTSTTLTTSVGLSGAANANAPVYTYTTALEKPLRVLNARKRRGTSNEDIYDIPLMEVGYQDYQEFSVKTSGSYSTQFSFIPSNTYSTMYLWPAPSDGAERIMFTYERKIEDLDHAGDDFDFPSEWLEAITYNLAIRLARPFGKASAIKDIFPLANSMLDDLLNWDCEHSYFQLTPTIENY